MLPPAKSAITDASNIHPLPRGRSPTPNQSEGTQQLPDASFRTLRVSSATWFLCLLSIDIGLTVVAPTRKHSESLEDQFVKQPTPPPTAEAHSPILSPTMPPKRKDSDAAFSARPPRKKSSPPAEVSASHAPEAPLAPTRRSARSTRSTVNYRYEVPSDAEDSDIDDRMAVDDSDEDHFTTSEDEQSASSMAPSDLDVSSDHSESPDQSEYGSDVEQPSLKRVKATNGRPRSAVKSAPENGAVVDSAHDADTKQKKSRAKPKVNMLNLNTGMKKEVDLTLPPLFGTQSIFDDLVAKALKKPSPNHHPRPTSTLLDTASETSASMSARAPCESLRCARAQRVLFLHGT
jgi:hypothetical protein